MSVEYSTQLKELMKLVLDDAPKNKIHARASDLKLNLTASFMELQRVINLIDGIVNQYAPVQDWRIGFVFPQSSTSTSMVAKPVQTRLPGIGKTSPIGRRPQRILEIAKGAIVEGVVNVQDVRKQLQAEGDQRKENVIAITVGNVLVRHGYQRVGAGKYKLREDKEGRQ